MILFLRLFWLTTLIILIAAPCQAASFEPWSEEVFNHIKEEYGAAAEKRIRGLHELIRNNQHLATTEKLALVNTTINTLPWIADGEHWRQADYWATPLETIATFGGDCEDMAIAKWVLLNHLGIASSHLRLAYTRVKRTGENHMVLLYIDNPEEPPEKYRTMVLDNLVPEIKTGKERGDLLAIYLTDHKGTLTLIADTGTSREIKGVYQERPMKRLTDLKKAIRDNRQRLRELNGGRDLLPPGQ